MNVGTVKRNTNRVKAVSEVVVFECCLLHKHIESGRK